MDIYFNVHLVSDSTGETLNAMMRAACARFERIRPVEHNYYLVRSVGKIDAVLANIEAFPGLVFYTLVDSLLRQRLEGGCAGISCPALPVIEQATNFLGSYLGLESDNRVAGQHVLDSSYFKRMEALRFCLAHDDGQGRETMHGADIVLVGVSRTSKTPTCIYLGNRGIKAGNIPFVPGVEPDFRLQSGKNRPLFIGLKISPERLIQIRRSRLLSMRDSEHSAYASSETVREEILIANRLYKQMNWPIIDVSRRSVEETAAAVLNLFAEHRAELKT